MKERKKRLNKRHIYANNLRRKTKNFVRILQVSLILFPVYLIGIFVCRYWGLYTLSWGITGLIAGLFVAFSLLSVWVSYRWLHQDHGRKSVSPWFEIFYWYVLLGFIWAFAAFVTEKTLAIGCVIALGILVSVCAVGEWLNLILFALAQCATLLFIGWMQHFYEMDYAYLCVICILCLLLTYRNQITYQRRIADRTAVEDAISSAETDPMTRLLNRRGMQRRVDSIWPMCVRENVMVSIVMLDIDNFKKYNDCYGHLKGDDCICRVATQIAYNTRRKTDFTARVGGEEFLAMLYSTDEKQALAWAMRLKERVEGLLIPQASDNFLPYVTVSMGIATRRVDVGDEFETLQQEADVALYQAKDAGRACIMLNGECYAKTQQNSSQMQDYREQGFRSL